MPNVLGLAPAGIWAFSPPGHLCVLIFFMLSGYVRPGAPGAAYAPGHLLVFEKACSAFVSQLIQNAYIERFNGSFLT